MGIFLLVLFGCIVFGVVVGLLRESPAPSRSHRGGSFPGPVRSGGHAAPLLAGGPHASPGPDADMAWSQSTPAWSDDAPAACDERHAGSWSDAPSDTSCASGDGGSGGPDTSFDSCSDSGSAGGGSTD